MRRIRVLLLILCLAPGVALAADRVPGKEWLRYVDVAEAGFDPEALAAAETTWRSLPSSAFMVVSDGAVVAAWGDVERRFMCHSVRKSFLSAIFGVYWDRGEVELNRTMAEIGIEEPDDPLLERETQARILDLLKARSGVFHPAAYAGRTDSRPRGSEGPGQYFAYNNWDFNTLAAILAKETGADVFRAWDEHFAKPLGMTDWRLSDGYYHYERDKSQYPAYPFRLSARDAARFGLLFAREGRWGERRVLSRHWVRRSTALYSIDDERLGYGFMWWVAREPRFERYGMVAALGVGNQMIAVLPDIDLVIVNRADTYRGEGTPMDDLLDLIETVLDARASEPVDDPALEPIPEAPRKAFMTEAPAETLTEMTGEWPYPPERLGLPTLTTVEIAVEGGHLVTRSPRSGTFRHYLQEDGWLVEEDSHERYLPVRDAEGRFTGLTDDWTIVRSALVAAAGGDAATADGRMGWLVEEEEEAPHRATGRLMLELVNGTDVDTSAQRLSERYGAGIVRRRINGFGYLLLEAGLPEPAETIFRLNTRLTPEVANTWDSLGEALMALGRNEEAIASYERSLELDAENSNAAVMIERLRSESR